MAFGDEGEDAWERKRRTRYQESDLSRRLLQIARDPNVTAGELEAVADEAMAHLNAQWTPYNGCILVLEALAAHPNTPPARFDSLLLRASAARRGFCRNPVAPFLLLENPDFIASLHEYSQRELLSEAALPPTFVHLLAADGGPRRPVDIQETARLHVAFAGEAKSQTEWETQARDFYRKVAREESDWEAREWHADLVEIGLLPSWADGGIPFSEPKMNLYGATNPTLPSRTRELNIIVTLPSTPTQRLVEALKQGDLNVRRLARRHPNAPPDANEICRRDFADQWGNGISALLEKYDRSESTRQQALITLTSALHGSSERQHDHVVNKGISPFWTDRFEAVWIAPLGDASLPGSGAGCTGRDLLDHLSRDANRIVRGAANTRLADPAYRFTV